MKRLQTQQPDIAGAIGGDFQAAAVYIPADVTQTWQQTVAILTGIYHQQTAHYGCIDHDCSLTPK
ncbi:hypothetical protein D3C81_2150640 [compost metagenome]